MDINSTLSRIMFYNVFNSSSKSVKITNINTTTKANIGFTNVSKGLLFYSNGTAVCSNTLTCTGNYNMSIGISNNFKAFNDYELVEGSQSSEEPFNLTVLDTGIYKRWSISSSIYNSMFVPVNLSFGNCASDKLIILRTKDGLTTYPSYTCNNNRLVLNATLNYSTSSNIIEAFYGLSYTEDYTNTVYSGSLNNFEINVSYNTTAFTSITGTIIYNNTYYSGIVTPTSYGAIINVSINAPIVYTSSNVNFYWNLTFKSGTSSFYWNTSANTQTVLPLFIVLCNTTSNTSFLNFTIKDDKTKLDLNASFEANFQIGENNYTYTYPYENKSNYAFCFNPVNQSFVVTAEVEYFKTNYARNYYYLNNANLTNQTTSIDLYLLNDSIATLTVLKVVDDSNNDMKNVFITIQEYDIGTNTFYTVGMAKTDYNGEDIAYLNWYDTFYRFILTRNNTVILITNTTKVSATPKKFQVKSKQLFPYDKFDKIIYSLTYNNDTKNFILTYILPDGSVTDACLRVIKRTSKNDTTICNICEQSSSATLYCNIANSGNGTFIATFYAKGSYGFIDSITELVNVSNRIYELLDEADRSFYAFLFAGIVTMMFLITPVLGIIGAILGFIGAMALGFTAINIAEFFGIVIIGGIIIWLIKR